MRKYKKEMCLEDAWKCFDEAPYASLGLSSKEGTPYIVALSMVRIGENIYFHCAKEGQKWDMIEANHQVCISAVSYAQNNEPKFSVDYKSCTIQGTASFVQDPEEKLQALYAICGKYSPSQQDRFKSYLEHSVEGTGIVKIEVTSITGKHSPVES